MCWQSSCAVTPWKQKTRYILCVFFFVVVTAYITGFSRKKINRLLAGENDQEGKPAVMGRRWTSAAAAGAAIIGHSESWQATTAVNCNYIARFLDSLHRSCMVLTRSRISHAVLRFAARALAL